MFPKIVSNLSFSPQVASQLTFYLRRLRKEEFTRRLSVVAGVLLVVLQSVIIMQPTSNINAASNNDIVFGGLNTQNPRADMLAIYDRDSDSAGHNGYRVLFNHFRISRQDIERTTQTNISSSDRSLLSIGRSHNFAADVAINLTSASPAAGNNPFACPHAMIRQNDRGDCVKHLQWYLNHRFGSALAIDGVFGPLTDRATRDFQRSRGLAVDGIAGPNTWSALHSLTASTNSHVYYQRPLYLWDNGRPNSYPALAGKRSDGSAFWILVGCGNIVVKTATPPPAPVRTVTPPPAPRPIAPPPKPTPPPAPKPVTPPPAPRPTPPPPPAPTAPPVTILLPQFPQLSLSKTAAYLNRQGPNGQALLASTAPAVADDMIEYTLTTSNTGKGEQKDYQPTEHINDIVEYADIADLRGANRQGNILTWPTQNIAPGANLVNTFVVKVKNPVPSTPRSLSDPLSFDLRIDNIYGNEVHVAIAAPPAKQVEAVTQTLPQTGNGTSLAVIGGFIALSIYFYLRNRQLMLEVQILRVDHNPGV